MTILILMISSVKFTFSSVSANNLGSLCDLTEANLQTLSNFEMENIRCKSYATVGVEQNIFDDGTVFWKLPFKIELEEEVATHSIFKLIWQAYVFEVEFPAFKTVDCLWLELDGLTSRDKEERAQDYFVTVEYQGVAGKWVTVLSAFIFSDRISCMTT